MCHERQTHEYVYSMKTVSVAGKPLLADPEFLNDGFVSLGVVILEVVQQTPSFAHQHQKTAPGSVVLLVRLEVLRQFANAFTKDSDLNFGTPRIRIVRPILADDALFALSR